ncbi:MAG TPA: hypothetical protein VFA81_10540 [Burkholderiales bacterium]|nr:hypothetical protein [Burkholderiales bacterium]
MLSTRIAVVFSLLVLAGVPWRSSVAQTPRDDIDRNLQERAVREREFHIELDAVPRVLPQSPAVTRRSATLPTPGIGILEPPPSREPPPRPPDVIVAPGVANESFQLDESQRRRQLELQSQTRPLDESVRRPLLDRQQLQFEREQRADQLQSEIMRNSDRALRGR